MMHPANTVVRPCSTERGYSVVDIGTVDLLVHHPGTSNVASLGLLFECFKQKLGERDEVILLQRDTWIHLVKILNDMLCHGLWKIGTVDSS